jgi:hypothetical protein
MTATIVKREVVRFDIDNADVCDAADVDVPRRRFFFQ